jgi:sensor histidine kinase regulating citrate/malate metabolism
MPYIYVENPVHKPVDLEILGNGSTKKDFKNHGLGIHNLLRVVNKYNGDIKFINELGIFRVEILLIDVLEI